MPARDGGSSSSCDSILCKSERERKRTERGARRASSPEGKKSEFPMPRSLLAFAPSNHFFSRVEKKRKNSATLFFSHSFRFVTLALWNTVAESSVLRQRERESVEETSVVRLKSREGKTPCFNRTLSGKQERVPSFFSSRRFARASLLPMECKHALESPEKNHRRKRGLG